MTAEGVDDVLDGLVETLADIEHRRWAHWQTYLHSKALRQPDGSLLIPADLVARWEKQMRTDYKDLDEGGKCSDRAQVAKYLPIIGAALKNSLCE
jgi:hypothetical protein